MGKNGGERMKNRDGVGSNINGFKRTGMVEEGLMSATRFWHWIHRSCCVAATGNCTQWFCQDR